MARVNVRSTVEDESAVIPAQEGPSSFIAGIIDPDSFPENLLGSLGTTQEREQGYMTISSVGELHERIRNNEPTGFPNLITDAEKYQPFYHLEPSGAFAGNAYAGGTFERWPEGPKHTTWEYIFSIAENYLQYGGSLLVFSPKTTTETTSDAITRAKNKKIAVDAFISPFFSENNNIRSIVDYRQDCIAITSIPSEYKAGADLRQFPSSDIEGSDNFNSIWPYDPITGFYNGTTYQIGETYEAVPASPVGDKYPIARKYFDRPFVVNGGNTFSYPPGRNVFSVRYFDMRPTAFNLGSTTDVVDYTRFFNGTMVATARGVVGMTFDSNSAEAIAIGVTRGNTFAGIGSVQSSSRGWWLYPKDVDIDGAVDRNSDFAYDTYPNLGGTPYGDYIRKLTSPGGITYFDNSRFSTRPGEIVIAQRLSNFVDYSSADILNTWQYGGPTIKETGNSYGTIFFEGLGQSLNANFIPGNHYDPYTFTMELMQAKHNSSDLSVFYPPEYRILANSESTRQRTQEEDLEHGISTVFFDLGYTDLLNGESNQVNQLTNNYSRIELMDLRKTLDPNYTPLDYLYGSTFGNNPNQFLYDEIKQITQNFNSVDLGAFGIRPDYDLATTTFKSYYNIFGPTGPTSGIDLNGNSPMDFWGCTCSRIPEFLKTFNLIGITPDVCVEVGPNSRTQDVTAEGSTYAAYIGFSDAMPRIFIRGFTNIFGEEIGDYEYAGTTLDDFYDKLNSNPAANGDFDAEQLGFANNDTITVPVQSLVFYPLVEDDSESSSYGLTKDTDNYFYACSYRRQSGDASAFSVFNMAQTDVKYDPNIRGLFSQYEILGEISEVPSTSGLQASDVLDGGEFRTAFMLNDVPTSIPLVTHTSQTNSVGTPFPNGKVFDARSRPLGYALNNSIGIAGSPGSTLINQFVGTGGVSLDGWYNDGIYLLAELDVVPGLPANSQAIQNGILRFAPSDFAPFDPLDFTYNNIFSSNADLYEFPVFGEKYAQDSYEAYKSLDEANDLRKANEIPFTSDVAGMFARLFRDLYPWYSPANQAVSYVTDIIAERYHLSNTEQDDLYDNKINFIKQIDGALKLWGDKTFANSTSTFSRVNVANLFIYLKKKIEPLGRRFLFEQNDAQSRELFVNAVEPFLTTLKGNRAITDFRVICDETNNTPDIVDSNQFVAEILVKPTKTINYIRLKMTNVGTSFELE